MKFDSSLIIGRFSGVHKGHAALIKRADIGRNDQNHKLIICVITGEKTSKNIKKNPLTFDHRRVVLNMLLDEMQIEAEIIEHNNGYVPDIIDKLKPLYDINYVYCGSDREKDYARQLKNHHAKLISVNRNIDTDDISGASATKLREAVINNDETAFKDLLPVELYDKSHDLFIYYCYTLNYTENIYQSVCVEK